MEHDARRVAPLLAAAAIVCGGVLACLLLLAGPAQADESGPPQGSGPVQLEPLGDTAGDVTRDVGRRTGDLVREVSAPAAPLAPVGEGAAEQVTSTTDGLADGVEQATEVVDEVVDEPVLPAPDAPPPSEQADDTDQDAGDRAERPLGTRAGRPDVRRDRDWQPAPRGVRATRATPVADPAPSPTLLTTTPHAGTHVPTAVPDPGSLPLVAGCDDCAATGSSSGDTLHVLGLPSKGVTTPRSADVVPRDAVLGGPTTIFHRPDVSPD